LAQIRSFSNAGLENIALLAAGIGERANIELGNVRFLEGVIPITLPSQGARVIFRTGDLGLVGYRNIEADPILLGKAGFEVDYVKPTSLNAAKVFTGSEIAKINDSNFDNQYGALQYVNDELRDMYLNLYRTQVLQPWMLLFFGGFEVMIQNTDLPQRLDVQFPEALDFSLTDSGTELYWSNASADPVQNMIDTLENIRLQIGSIDEVIMGQETWMTFKNHAAVATDIATLFKGILFSDRNITPTKIAQAYEFPQINVVDATYPIKTKTTATTTPSSALTVNVTVSLADTHGIRAGDYIYLTDVTSRDFNDLTENEKKLRKFRVGSVIPGVSVTSDGTVYGTDGTYGTTVGTTTYASGTVVTANLPYCPEGRIAFGKGIKANLRKGLMRYGLDLVNGKPVPGNLTDWTSTTIWTSNRKNQVEIGAKNQFIYFPINSRHLAFMRVY